jgi:hypothetical protein
MRTIIRLAGTSAMIGALAACGGGGSGGVTRLYATDAGTVGKAVQDGKTLTAQSGGSVGANLDYGTGDTGLTATAPKFRVWKNANGELSYEVDGVVQDFTTAQRYIDPNDGNAYGYDTNGVNNVWSGLYNYNGTLDEALDPNNPSYLTVWGYQTNQINPNGQPDLRGFAVVGTETRTKDLAPLVSATYSGRARMDAQPDTGWVDGQTSRTRIRSDMDLAANFSAGTISGALTNFTIQPPGQAEGAVAGSVSMDATTLSGNGFAGNLTPDAAFLTSLGANASMAGTYGGTFYGPAAEQVGGTLSATGSANGQSFNALGFYTGTKN